MARLPPDMAQLNDITIGVCLACPR